MLDFTRRYPLKASVSLRMGFDALGYESHGRIEELEIALHSQGRKCLQKKNCVALRRVLSIRTSHGWVSTFRLQGNVHVKVFAKTRPSSWLSKRKKELFKKCTAKSAEIVVERMLDGREKSPLSDTT